MLTFLEEKDDYGLVFNINFADSFSRENIKQQIEAVLKKTARYDISFSQSVEFLKNQLEDVLSAKKSLEIVQSRYENVQSSLDFITKSRMETVENTKGVVMIDLSRGLHDGMVYSVGLKGLTFGTELLSETSTVSSFGSVPDAPIHDTMCPMLPKPDLVVTVTIPYKPISGDVFLYMPVNQDLIWKAGAPNALGKLYSIGHINIPILILIKKNGVTLGNITCPPNGYDFIYDIPEDIILQYGDILELVMSDTGTIDPLIQGFGLTFYLSE